MVCEDPVRDLEAVEFCQSKPVWTPQGYVMCRNPHTALVKDTMCLKRIVRENEWRSWVRSVGECGMALAGGIPMFQEFYSAYVRSAGRAKVYEKYRADGGLKLAAKGMHRRYSEIHPKTRYSFYVAWGILPDAQIAAEQVYSTINMFYRDPTLIEYSQSLPSLF